MEICFRQLNILFQMDDVICYNIFVINRFYLGRTPTYFIADADLLKQILVKEFTKFPNRPLAVSIKLYNYIII